MSRGAPGVNQGCQGVDQGWQRMYKGCQGMTQECQGMNQGWTRGLKGWQRVARGGPGVAKGVEGVADHQNLEGNQRVVSVWGNIKLTGWFNRQACLKQAMSSKETKANICLRSAVSQRTCEN